MYIHLYERAYQEQILIRDQSTKTAMSHPVSVIRKPHKRSANSVVIQKNEIAVFVYPCKCNITKCDSQHIGII